MKSITTNKALQPGLTKQELALLADFQRIDGNGRAYILAVIRGECERINAERPPPLLRLVVS